MDELNDMKNLWRELNERISALEEDNRRLARKVMNENFKTVQEKLIRKYTFFIIIAVVMIFYMWIFVWFNPDVVEKYKVVTSVYWSVFFILEAGIDFYLRHQVKQIDIYNSSVKDIALQAAKNWRVHKIAVFCGIPVAIGAVILFGLLLNADMFVIYCMIAGGMIGLLVGIRQLKKFYENYRILQTEE